MKDLNNRALGALAAVWLIVASSQSASAAPLHEACNADIEKLCSNVTPGSGRIMACLYAHEDNISDECDAATSDIADVIDAVLGTVGDAIAICLPAIKKHCAGTKFGEGRVLSCLDEKKAELSGDCKEVVSQLSGQLLD